jgi:hypothetical protein
MPKGERPEAKELRLGKMDKIEAPRRVTWEEDNVEVQTSKNIFIHDPSSETEAIGGRKNLQMSGVRN